MTVTVWNAFCISPFKHVDDVRTPVASYSKRLKAIVAAKGG